MNLAYLHDLRFMSCLRSEVKDDIRQFDVVVTSIIEGYEIIKVNPFIYVFTEISSATLRFRCQRGLPVIVRAPSSSPSVAS